MPRSQLSLLHQRFAFTWQQLTFDVILWHLEHGNLDRTRLILFCAQFWTLGTLKHITFCDKTWSADTHIWRHHSSVLDLKRTSWTSKWQIPSVKTVLVLNLYSRFMEKVSKIVFSCACECLARFELKLMSKRAEPTGMRLSTFSLWGNSPIPAYLCYRLSRG